MYNPTYAEIKANLQKELDLEEETFITPEELLKYCNEGIELVSSDIHSIYEDYFLTNTTLNLVNGQAQYDLPSDIYAQKIRHIVYNDNGSKNYEIRRIKQIRNISNIQSEDLYQYLITNSAVSGNKLTIYPTPQEDSSYTTIWYLRNAKRITADTDTLDIPEFSFVVVQYMRWKCLDKERRDDAEAALRDLNNMRAQMIDTLTARIPDEQNYIDPDFSFYAEFDNDIYGGRL